MPAFVLSVLLYLPLLVGFAAAVAEKQDRAFLFQVVVLAWIGLAPLVAMVNLWMPFAGVGDDYSYYVYAQMPIRSLGDVFDFSRFVGLLEQPGFAWLLSISNIVANADLLAFKLLNLFFLLAMALTWYRIGVLLETPRFGRRVMVGVVLLTPLWYYVFFLLKDLVIAWLQSLFLMGLVWQWSRAHVARPWLLAGVATFSLILFRVQVVLQNVAVGLGALILAPLGRGRGRLRILPMAAGSVFIIVLLAVASNPQILSMLGLYEAQRVLFSEEMRSGLFRHQEASQIRWILFPLLYLLSETAGLSPDAWSALDSSWLRGVLALPWIFLLVPFFGLGVLWLLHEPHALPRKRGLVLRLRSSRLVSTPWGVLVLFILSSLAVSWAVGDTTRWRISDMPAMLTVALAGWMFASRRLRHQVLAFWLLGGGSLFALFYLLRSL